MTETTKQHATLHDIASRWEQWRRDEFPRHIERRLRGVGTFSGQAIERISELSNELERLLAVGPALRAIDFFLARSATQSNRLDRYATIRVLETLDQVKGEPIAWPGGWSPEDPNQRERILQDTEIGLVRLISLKSAARTGPVATLDAGAVSGELGILRGSNLVTLSEGGFSINAPGTQRASGLGYTMAAPRTLTVSSWATSKFKTLAEATEPDDFLLYAGSASTTNKIQSSILMSVTDTLQRAGLSQDPTVRPLSIRNTAGRRAHDEGGLEAAAVLLGHDDFNSVAKKIGLQRHAPVRKRRVREVTSAAR